MCSLVLVLCFDFIVHTPTPHNIHNVILHTFVVTHTHTHRFLHTYQQSVQEVKDHLLGHTFHSKLPFIGKSTSPHSIPLPVMDHLSCFYPGMLALGLLNGLHPDQSALAAGLTHTCYYAYEAMPTGLAPDIFRLITFQGATEDITIRESSSAVSVILYCLCSMTGFVASIICN